jgi:hypothetical protein
MINRRRKDAKGRREKMRIKAEKIKNVLVIAGEIALEVILIVICRKRGEKKNGKRRK